MRAPFSLLNRNGTYYVRIWDGQQGRYLTPKSTRCGNKAKAEAIARQWVKERKLGIDHNANPFLIEFARTFWTWDESTFIAKRLIRDPDGISKGYVAYNLHYVEKYAKRFFGRMKISEVRAATLEAYLFHLRKELPSYSNTTINRIMKAILQPIKEAYRLQIIETSPIRGSFRLPEHSPEKGIFTGEEIRALAHAEWLDGASYLAFQLAAICGLRLGEVRALRIEDLDIDHLTIRHSYSKTSGLKCPKNRRTRTVAVPAALLEKLRNLAAGNKNADGYVFVGFRPGVPLSDKAICEGLYDAMGKVGIAKDARIARRLSFHSLRHWANAALRGEISDDKLRLLIGHIDPKMTDRYDHLTSMDLAAISAAQERRILPFIDCEKEAG